MRSLFLGYLFGKRAGGGEPEQLLVPEGEPSLLLPLAFMIVLLFPPFCMGLAACYRWLVEKK